MSNGEDWYTPVSAIGPTIERLRATVASRKTHSAAWRKSQLQAVLRLIEENRTELAQALEADMGQGDNYTDLFELSTSINSARFALEHLDTWMATEPVATPFPTNLSQPVHSELTSYPKGLVCIISPWNFPQHLVLAPLINAISAGCVCILKPSEISVHSSKLIARLLTEYIDGDALAIVLGGVEHSTELLAHRFDAISYTGGERVAKIVATAAAKHLTPMLLELGGKNPAIVCHDADVKSAATRIAWGKWAGNMGQFCLNTDYVLVVESLRDEFVAALKTAVLDFYGEDPKESKDVGRMISVQHAKRVVAMVDSSCRVLHGGTRHNVEERYVEPTLVEANVKSTIMKEEVFGPILAVVTVPDVDGAIQFVNKNFNNKGDHPLAMYVFSKSKINQRNVMDNVQSGMCCVNHVIFQGGNFQLPFGGVGNSGMGAYYGKYGFDFFSHKRGALVMNNFVSSRADPANWITLPPYNDKKLAAFRLLGKVAQLMGPIQSTAKVAMPVLLAVLLYRDPGLVDAAREFNINTLIGWIDHFAGRFRP